MESSKETLNINEKLPCSNTAPQIDINQHDALFPDENNDANNNKDESKFINLQNQTLDAIKSTVKKKA